MPSDKETKLTPPLPDGGPTSHDDRIPEPQPLPKATFFDAAASLVFALYTAAAVGMLAWCAWLLVGLAWQAIKRYFQIL